MAINMPKFLKFVIFTLMIEHTDTLCCAFNAAFG